MSTLDWYLNQSTLKYALEDERFKFLIRTVCQNIKAPGDRDCIIALMVSARQKNK
jgi:hypothetical protein